MDLFSNTLRKHYLYYLLDVRIDEVFLGYLYSPKSEGSPGVISEIEMEDIMGLRPDTMKAYFLHNILSKSGPVSLKIFIEALVYTNQIDLAEKLDLKKTRELLEK